MAKKSFAPINDDFYIPQASDVAITLTSIETLAETPDIAQSEQKTKKAKQHVIDLAEPQLLPGIGELAMIRLDHIMDSPYQTREGRDEDEYQQLVYSIKTLKKRIILFVCHHPQKDGFYFPVMGGHMRRDAAMEAGLTEMLVIIIDYDQQEVGLGTAQENLSRQDLDVVAKGKLFKKLREDFGWSQERLAKELGIRGVNRDTIASCEQTIKYALDIQRMIISKRDGGIRAAGYLDQLTDFYADQPGMAEQVRAPIIEAFLAEKIYTDGIRKKVEFIIHAGKREEVIPDVELDEQTIKRWTRIESTEKNLHNFIKLIADTSPTQEERDKLINMRQKIDTVLER